MVLMGLAFDNNGDVFFCFVLFFGILLHSHDVCLVRFIERCCVRLVLFFFFYSVIVIVRGLSNRRMVLDDFCYYDCCCCYRMEIVVWNAQAMLV